MNGGENQAWAINGFSYLNASKIPEAFFSNSFTLSYTTEPFLARVYNQAANPIGNRTELNHSNFKI